MKKQDWAALFLQALFGMFLFRIFLLLGLQRTSTAEAGVLTGTTPALTVLLAWLILRESPHWLRVLGIVNTIAGILLIQGLLSHSTHLSLEHLLGNLLVLAAALCESLFNVFSRLSSIRNRHTESLKPLVQTTLVTAIAFLLCLVPCFFEQPISSLMSLSISEWLALLWYGLFITALGYMCWYTGIKRCETSVAAAFSGLMPLTAMLLSVLLLGEQTVVRQWLGAALVILGMLASGVNPPDVYRYIRSYNYKPI